MACGILVPQPGIKPGPLAVKVQSPNHGPGEERESMGINEDNWVDLVVRIKADSCLAAFLGCCCCCFN